MLLLAGMYRERHASSRIDESVSLIKVVTVGALIVFFIVIIVPQDPRGSLSIFVIYWASVLGLIVSGRILVRSVQKALINDTLSSIRLEACPVSYTHLTLPTILRV